MTKIVKWIIFAVFLLFSLISTSFFVTGLIDYYQLGDFSAYAVINVAAHGMVALIWAVLAILHFGGKHGSDT